MQYFSSAAQIGMTATPKETKTVSNIDYFGEPLYTYTLKQGIDDGFLAPYKVIRIGLNIDEGWRPETGQTDIDGNEIEDREYNEKDFDRNIVIVERTQKVAKRISDFLKSTNRFDKTIVFCVGIEHAARMRAALINENQDLVLEDSRYVMRITGDDPEGKKQLDNFIDLGSRYPTIATTSKLLTTGVDCKTCKLIAIDRNINSMTEFKQIIGRGTRINSEYGKEFFTIMDFRGVSRMFADKDFDGEPISILEECPTFRESQRPYGDDNPKPPPPPPPPEPRKIIYVDGVEVEIINEVVRYLDKSGKLIAKSIVDYSKENILGEFATLDDFLKEWNERKRKQAVIDELKERGVLIDALRESAGNRDIDDFDLICHIVFDKKPLTKAERAANVRKRGYLSRYEGIAREVLSALLDKYADEGIADIDDKNVLLIDPFRKIGGLPRIFNAFNGEENYLQAVRELQSHIYESS